MHALSDDTFVSLDSFSLLKPTLTFSCRLLTPHIYNYRIGTVAPVGGGGGGGSGEVVNALGFRSEGRWFDAQSLPSCCFLIQETLPHIVYCSG